MVPFLSQNKERDHRVFSVKFNQFVPIVASVVGHVAGLASEDALELEIHVSK